MGQKLNQVELEDVSGGNGCNGTTYYSKLFCYDSNNALIEKESTHTSNNEKSANNTRDQKIYQLFSRCPKVQYIKWELLEDGVKINEGTKYR